MESDEQTLHKVQTSRVNRVRLPDCNLLQELFRESGARHQHLCPRQVLGIRLGLSGLRALSLFEEAYSARYSNRDRRLLTIAETDGCAADGLAVATSCAVGKRTLRIFDIGKVAATLVDISSGRAVRVAPTPQSRELAVLRVPDVPSRWHAYLEAYQVMADDELIHVQDVQLTQTVAEIISKPEARAVCDLCREEIINEREVNRGGRTLCKTCAGETYYQVLSRL